MAEAKDTTKKASTSKTTSATKSANTTKTSTPKKPVAKTTAKATGTTKTTTATKSVASKSTATKTAEKPVAKKSANGEKSNLLKLHHLKPAEGARKSKMRVGRGEASKGKTAGRGTKGTKARNTVAVGFEGGQIPLHMRLPKLRGFKNPFRIDFQVVNLDRLEKVFPTGGKVSVEDLILKGLVRNGLPVKILGQGEVTQKFDIVADKFSASAIKKIEAAGGTAKTVLDSVETTTDTKTNKKSDDVKSDNKKSGK